MIFYAASFLIKTLPRKEIKSRKLYGIYKTAAACTRRRRRSLMRILKQLDTFLREKKLKITKKKFIQMSKNSNAICVEAI
jgi:hypothetical protein